MGGLKVPYYNHYIYAGEDGKTILEFSGNERELKKSNYVLTFRVRVKTLYLYFYSDPKYR
jgi:hypothetical protein